MVTLKSRPVLGSVVASAALIVVLAVLAVTVPMSENVEHFSGHAALGIPLVLLLVLALARWPPPGPELAARLARRTLLVGLAVAGFGLLTEAVGAFGYSADGSGRASALANLHDVGVAVWPIGFVLTMVGTILTFAVSLAARRDAAGSRIVKTAAVVALAAAIAFVGGGLIFGY